MANKLLPRAEQLPGGLVPNVAASGAATGGGGPTAMVSPTTNGTVLGTLPEAARGARFYLAAADSVTFTIATAAPGGAPTPVVTLAGVTGSSGDTVIDEPLSQDQNIYVTAASGSPRWRWVR